MTTRLEFEIDDILSALVLCGFCNSDDTREEIIRKIQKTGEKLRTLENMIVLLAEKADVYGLIKLARS